MLPGMSPMMGKGIPPVPLSVAFLGYTTPVSAGTSNSVLFTVPASEKVVLGFIGVGGMGTGLLKTFQAFPDVQVAAVCDVYEPHRLRARAEAGGRPSVYKDFRQTEDFARFLSLEGLSEDSDV